MKYITRYDAPQTLTNPNGLVMFEQCESIEELKEKYKDWLDYGLSFEQIERGHITFSENRYLNIKVVIQYNQTLYCSDRRLFTLLDDNTIAVYVEGNLVYEI